MLIRKITIRRFRGIGELEWEPVGPGFNCLVGPGDAGKSTVLEALDLLLAPRPATTLSEFDYNNRDTTQGFEISAVCAQIDEELLEALRVPPLRGWKDGRLLPAPEGDAEPVLELVASADEHMELRHYIRCADDTEARFGVSLRQRVQLARLSTATSAGSELRLRRGSLLQRYLGGEGLRAPLAKALADASTELRVPDDLRGLVEELSRELRGRGLPHAAALGLTPPFRESLISLISLMAADPQGAPIPVALSGMGTRSMLLSLLVVLLSSSRPLVIADEPECGLEPYRQRRLIKELRTLVGRDGQAFITTHSPSILAAMETHELARMEPSGTIHQLQQGPSLDRLLARDAEVFLCRTPVICEGATEVGFLGRILDHFAKHKLTNDPDAHGLVLVEGQGQPGVLREAEALWDLGIGAAVFVDSETKHEGLRSRLAGRTGCCFFAWGGGVRNVEEAVVARVTGSALSRLPALAATCNQGREQQYLQQLGEALKAKGAPSVDELVSAHGDAPVREVLARVAQDRKWFKTRQGGEALAQFVIDEDEPRTIGELRGFVHRLSEFTARS